MNFTSYKKFLTRSNFLITTSLTYISGSTSIVLFSQEKPLQWTEVHTHVSTKQIAPNKCCGIFFAHWFGQVHWSINVSKENVVVFFHHNYDYFILCDNQNLVSFFYILISTKIQAFGFLQIHSYTNVFLKFHCDAKLITPLLIF